MRLSALRTPRPRLLLMALDLFDGLGGFASEDWASGLVPPKAAPDVTLFVGHRRAIPVAAEVMAATKFLVDVPGGELLVIEMAERYEVLNKTWAALAVVARALGGDLGVVSLV